MYILAMNDFREWVQSIGGSRVAAERIGCSQVAIRKYLTGERRPRPKMAERIEQVSGGIVDKTSWYWPTEAA